MTSQQDHDEVAALGVRAHQCRRSLGPCVAGRQAGVY